MSEIYHFDSPFVYSSIVSEHQSLKRKFIPKIEKYVENISQPKEWACNCKSSFSYTKENKDVNKDVFGDDNEYFTNIIWKYFDLMLSEYPYLSKGIESSICQSLWFNYYIKDQYQEVHNHNGNPMIVNDKILYKSYSGIYILHQDFNEEGTIFYSTDEDVYKPYSGSSTIDKYQPKLEQGHILIFPSNLSHYVAPAKGKRITVSFNICSSYHN